MSNRQSRIENLPSPISSRPEPRITPSLPRAIGPLGSTAIVVGSIIGSGIFLVPHNVAQRVGTVRSLLLVWVVGGVLSLAGALSLAELGAAIPEAGGVYIYLRQAYGKLAAFLYSWSALAVIESGSIATLAVAFGIYSGVFFPPTRLEQNLVNVPSWLPAFFTPSPFALRAAVVIVVLTLVNVLGVRQGARVQTLFTFAKLLGLAIIVGYALFSRGIAPTASSLPLPTPHTTVSSFGVALIGVLWAYQGWQILSYAAGEVKEPARVLPLSYFLGTLLVVIVYLSANLAYLRVLPLAALAEHQRVAAKAMEVLAGPGGAAFVSALILCSIFGALNGTVLGGARVCFAMARDGLFFSSVGRVHPRFATPAPALLIQGAWSILLAISGTYEQLYTYVIFTVWIFYAATVLGLIILRRRLPTLARPYRVWGYPYLPIAFTLAALAIVANTLASTPREAFIGLGLVLLGLPVYFGWKTLARSR